MGKFRFGFRLLAALTLLAGLAKVGLADSGPTAAQLLGYKPTQKTVEVTTPAAADHTACTVELEKGKALPDGKQPTAWVVKDASGRILRKFHDTTGGGGVNIIAYFRDGEEVYRELVTGNKINQFRWVGPDGSKWGLDSNGDGKIDTWTVISPEEVSQEVLAAVLTKDQKRFEALLMTDADLEALGLAGPEAQRIKTKLASAAGTFQKTCTALAGLKPTTQWIHAETKLPQTTPADVLDSKQDVIRYKHAAVLYQDGNGQGAKADWIQLGEMIQVGKAWRLVQGPTPGMAPAQDAVAGGAEPGGIKVPAGAEKLIQELNELDKAGPGSGKDGLVTYNLKRASILEKIAALYTAAEDATQRNVWLKQVADCYASAAQQGDTSALARLGQWLAVLAKEPGSTALPYFTFRRMSAEYALELPKASQKGQEALTKLQEGWKEKLAKFVNDHPTTDDTPDAIMQLGMVNEYFGPKAEADAKTAYGLLVKNFPNHQLARRAQGCIDRLTLEGKELDLTAPTLAGGPAFDVRSLRGKAVLVYYWASWNDLAATDFNKIKLALKDYAGKAELVTVNLDQKAEGATAFLRANPIDGTHLFQAGGLAESPLAIRYGITALPVLFLVGPDGKVITRSAQASTVDEELKKLFKGDEKTDK